MKNKTGKKIIAIMLSFCMLCITAFNYTGNPKTVYAEKNNAEQYKTITFSDCGIQDRSYTPQSGLFASGMASNVTSMDHVIMRGKVTFPSSGGWNAPSVFVGTTAVNAANGLHVFYTAGQIHVQDTQNGNATLGIVTSQQVGKSLCDVALDIAITFEYINSKDVSVSFAMDGVTYFVQTIVGGVGKYGAGFFVNGQSNAITVSSVTADDQEVTKNISTLTYADCKIQDGTYSPQEGLFATNMADGVTSMDQVELRGVVVFPSNGAWTTGNIWMGTTAKEATDGLNVFYNGGTGDKKIWVQDASNGYATFCTITPEQVGKDLYDTPLEIAVLFEHINEKDICVTFSINGVTYMKKSIAGGVGKYGAGYFVNGQSAPVTVVSVNKEYETLTFRDSGILDGTYSPQEGLFATRMTEGITSMDMVELKGIVTFPSNGEWTTGNIWMGTTAKEATDGFNIFYNGGTGDKRIWVQNASKEYETFCVVTPEQVGKDLYNTPLEIAFTFEYLNETDVLVAFSIDGTVYERQLLKGAASKYGAGYFVNGQNAAITVKSVENKEEKLEVTGDEKSFLSFGYLTPSTHENMSIENSFTGDIEELLDGGVIRQKMKVVNGTDGGFVVLFANPESAWEGIQFRFHEGGVITVGIEEALRKGEAMAGDAMFEIHPAFAGVDSFLNNEFELGLAFDRAGDDKEDLVMRVYINGVLYKGKRDLDYVNGAMTIPNAAKVIAEGRTDLNLLTMQNGSVTLYGEAEPVKKPLLTTLQTEDLDLDKALYTYASGALSIMTQYKKGLMNTIYSEEVTFTANSWLHYAGTESGDATGWTGLRFMALENGNIQVLHTDSDTIYTLTSEIAGVEKLVGEEIELTLELFEDQNNPKNAMLGVYINDKLYNGGYLMFKNLASKMGGYVSVYVGNADGSLRIGQEGEKDDIIVPKLTKITSEDIGLNKGVYVYNTNALSVTAKYKKGLMNTTYTEKMTFTTNSWFHYAGPEQGAETGWHGIRFMALENGNIQVYHTDGGAFYTLSPELAGVEKLVGEEIELTLELFKDQRNPENAILGVYVNGALYDSGYFKFRGLTSRLGNNVSIYVGDGAGFLTIGKQQPVPTIDKNFKKLSFASYGIHGSTYGYSGVYLAAEGNCGLDNLDGVVFSDKVNFGNVNGAQLRFGGKASAWTGLLFVGDGAGNIHLLDAEGAWGPIVFNSGAAGVQLTGQEVELTLSIQYVDSDQDGKKDDVKLGVWFNGRAYGYSWIYLENYAATLGGNCGIYCANEEATLTVAGGPIPVDFYEYGFTEKWESELGVEYFRKRK